MAELTCQHNLPTVRYVPLGVCLTWQNSQWGRNRNPVLPPSENSCPTNKIKGVLIGISHFAVKSSILCFMETDAARTYNIVVLAPVAHRAEPIRSWHSSMSCAHQSKMHYIHHKGIALPQASTNGLCSSLFTATGPSGGLTQLVQRSSMMIG